MAGPVGAIVARELHLWRKLWHAFLFSGFLQPALFLAAMGLRLGGLIDDRRGDVEGVSYLQFVAPGLLIASATQIAAFNSMWPVLGGLKWERRFHAQVATPIGPGDIHTGLLAWLAIRLGMEATAYLAIATAFGAVASWWGVLAVPATILCGTALASVVSAWAVNRDTDVAYSAAMRLGFMPLFLFSGTFFPVSTLPDGIEPLSWVSPLWHGAELARAATTGDAAPVDLAHALVLVGLLLAGSWWGRRSYTRRITP